MTDQTNPELHLNIHARQAVALALTLAVLALGFGWYTHTFPVLPSTAYSLIDELPPIQATDRVLLVSPHEDDETLGAGGFLQRAHERGAVITIVLATDGNRYGKGPIRHREELAAVQKLGLAPNAVAFLDFPDDHLRAHQAAFIAALTQLVQNFRPTIILSTLPADIHPDHSAVGDGVDKVAAITAPQATLDQFVIHYHRFPRPEGYHPRSVLLPPAALIADQYQWRKLTLTPDEEQTKEAAIRLYRSQLTDKYPFLKGLILSFVRRNELFVVRQPNQSPQPALPTTKSS